MGLTASIPLIAIVFFFGLFGLFIGGEVVWGGRGGEKYL